MSRTGIAAAMTISVVLVVSGLSVATSHAVAAAFELPSPTGPYAVGTTAWRLTDTARRETFTGSGEFRQVEVLAWYPAAPRRSAGLSRRSALAPYLREGLSEVRTFATLFRAPETAFDGLEGVRTHAEFDTATAAFARKFPVLVFSHGYTGIPSAYTALLEDLASHGYAVLSIVHPYEATAATLADGRIVTLLDNAGTLRPPIREVFGEWGAEDDTMAAVTRAADDAEQLRLLRGYLAGLGHTDIALRRWVDDTKLVLDRLSSVPAKSPAGQLAARLDISRVGVFGHSMGGVTAGQFCVEDRRCRAGLNLDGIPQYGTMIDKSMPRPFLMVYSARPGRLGASDAIYRRAAHPYYRIDVRDTRHLDFSDMTFWGGPLRERPVLGTVNPARASEITRVIVRRYFDQELLGQRATLPAGMSPFPEVAIRTIR
jgi:pimeloyl-ACP methyl ester carboxylesterase